MSRYLVLGKTPQDSFIVVDTAPPHNTFLVHKKVYNKKTPEIGCVYFLTVREDHITGIQGKCDTLESIGRSAFMAMTTLTISDPKHLNENRHRAYFRVTVNSDKHQALFEAIEPPADKKEAALKPSSSQNEGPNNKISSPVTSEDFTNKRSSPKRNGGRGRSSGPPRVRTLLPDDESVRSLNSFRVLSAAEQEQRWRNEPWVGPHFATPGPNASISPFSGVNAMGYGREKKADIIRDKQEKDARSQVSLSADEKKAAGAAFAKLYATPTIQLMMKNQPRELEAILKYFDLK